MNWGPDSRKDSNNFSLDEWTRSCSITDSWLESEGSSLVNKQKLRKELELKRKLLYFLSAQTHERWLSLLTYWPNSQLTILTHNLWRTASAARCLPAGSEPPASILLSFPSSLPRPSPWPGPPRGARSPAGGPWTGSRSPTKCARPERHLELIKTVCSSKIWTLLHSNINCFGSNIQWTGWRSPSDPSKCGRNQ